ncbi:MAG: DNA primase [Zetaproteobacteria bacterium CG_4_9_14_3_um_filter_49_83]|nr:MAG: DNA primase [Zetaproteobacteria bacterium CG1_02_49_23]PIQ34901.1 MAG: DNA primase [Zetaproteobacteria bacterium CG17_big_fil_post_rev_8_21_14_2_50_50_13]PIY55447.1 MAG: DNA primase [Zetaproteobacteria bacterium CG_4_10_14_0_8_um_filter_49_80]PJA35186.1 MAG: DNA primase [Zetaproteobacteria bacterium CG_4_9_14_3_um_filter_49_83]
MSNFTPSFLDQVLARTDLVELIARHVELKKSGSNMMGLCPFHHEKSPSFSVSADKQLYYCFGCGKGGGAFQFLMEHDGYSFPEAVEYLAEKAGLEIPQESASKPDDNKRRERALQWLSKVSEVYVRQLFAESGEMARTYLKRRKLPESIVRKYMLGYAPAGYGFMQRCFGEDVRVLAGLEAVGVTVKGDRGYIDRFRNRLMFPIRDRRGKVVGFGGRILADEQTAKYLNSPETDYFHKSDLLYGLSEHRDEIRKRKMLLVVEGYMDVLALAAHDLPIALAPLGTAIGENQLREIFRLHDQPVFCFDGDRAGRQAAWRALERMLPILKSEFAPRFLYLPEGEDPDSLVDKEGGDAFSHRILNDAQPVLQTWLTGLRNLAGKGADGRARMAKKAEAMLVSMTDDYLRQAWRQEAEKATRITLTHNETGGRRYDRTVSVKKRPVNIVQESFMVGLMQKPERLYDLPDDLKRINLDEEGLDRLYRRALDSIRSCGASEFNLIQQLKYEFPDDIYLAKWMNQAAVSDDEFASLIMDMQVAILKRDLTFEKDLSRNLKMQAALAELQKRQKVLRVKLEDSRWGDE